MSVPASNQTTLTGDYVDGRSARSRRVRVDVFSGEVRLSDPGTGESIAVWPRNRIEVRSFAENVTKIYPSEGADEELSLACSPADVLGAEYRRRPLVHQAALYLGGLVVAFMVLHFSMPAISKAIAHRVPIELERKLATGYEDFFAKDRCESALLNDRIRGILDRLHLGASPKYAYRVVVMNKRLDNAFALPGGLIVVGRTLLEKAETADEVAGVLAHEIQHVENRHITAGIIRASFLTAIWTLAIGDYSGVLVVDPTVAYQIMSLKFSRDDEAEADREALRMLDAAKIPRAGYANFFRRLSSQDPLRGIPEIISTHPGHEERIRMIEAGSDEGTLPVMDAAEWKSVRSLCEKEA